ncbi:hypothetical protein Ahy_B02g057622 [Arachis hypogaea]|uniref:Uncharacterized protein n=1 Tax=Arachis hypogaea TaxID=3818 RepID=A0A445ACG4_ARAHY|nr:hypothetical protein Ahy_B02g057622 [Arachis hypogaea]
MLTIFQVPKGKTCLSSRNFSSTPLSMRLEPVKGEAWRVQVGPTLFDVAAITDLPISNLVATFNSKPSKSYNIVHKNSYGDFIKHNMGKENCLITDDECVAFLYYWLNTIIFCWRGISMKKFFIPLAALLHEGHTFNLAKLLLGNLYDELGQLVDCLRKRVLINAGVPFGYSNFD